MATRITAEPNAVRKEHVRRPESASWPVGEVVSLGRTTVFKTRVSYPVA
jgi:hypothetical protein